MRWKGLTTRSTIWTVPSLYATASIAAGLVLPRLEQRWLPDVGSPISVSSATAIYSSVAGGTMALTAIVFSLTFLMVQFSATAYSPRLVLWLARDPLIAHALGVFSATFLYAIAALAWVDRDGSQLVPALSAWTLVALLVVSVAMFIALTQRIALLQINRMLAFTGDQGRRVIASMYPRDHGAETPAAPDGPPAAPPTQVVLHAGRPLAVQAIDVAALASLAAGANGVIDVTVAVGDTVMESTPILRVLGGRSHADEASLNRAIVRGEERTFDQDPKYAIRLLVDIAIRALSPAINDPTTAVQALDQIGDLLLRLGRRRLEVGVFRDDSDVVRVTVPMPTWEDFLQLAFDEICTCGAASVQVMRRMKALIGDLVGLLPDQRRPALNAWHDRLERTVAKHFDDPIEQAAASTEDRQGLGVSRTRPAA
jgi:uncharacterized membrane protein